MLDYTDWKIILSTDHCNISDLVRFAKHHGQSQKDTKHGKRWGTKNRETMTQGSGINLQIHIKRTLLLLFSWKIRVINCSIF